MKVLAIQDYEMRPLNECELDEVSAGVGPAGAVVGAVIGGVTYIGSVVGSGNGSVGGLAAAVGTGAVTGFFTPIPAGAIAAGASIISGTSIGFYAGMAGGFIERMM